MYIFAYHSFVNEYIMMKRIAVFTALVVFALCGMANNPLQGKIMNVLGDSYVANHRRPKAEAWHYKFAEKHGMKYNNYGRNGGCIAFDRTREGFGPSLMVRYKDMDREADLVVIIAGHNDAGFAKENKDSLKMVADSLDLLLTQIKQHCPKAKIAYVTPWYVGRSGFKEIVRIIRTVCRKHDVPVLNNYKKNAIIKVRDEEFRKAYFQGLKDTAHLNNEGHDLYFPVGEEFLLKVME